MSNQDWMVEGHSETPHPHHPFQTSLEEWYFYRLHTHTDNRWAETFEIFFVAAVSVGLASANILPLPGIFLLPELPHSWNQGFPTKLKRTWWPNFTSMQIITDSQQTLDTISCCLVKCDTDGWGIQGVSGGLTVNCDQYLDKSTHKTCTSKIVCSLLKNKRYAVIGLQKLELAFLHLHLTALWTEFDAYEPPWSFTPFPF